MNQNLLAAYESDPSPWGLLWVEGRGALPLDYDARAFSPGAAKYLQSLRSRNP